MGLCGRISQCANDTGQKERKCVQRSINSHVHQHSDPRLPILESGKEGLPFEAFATMGGLTVLSQSQQNNVLLQRLEEFRIIREIDNNKVRAEGDDDGEQSFDDELRLSHIFGGRLYNPGPTWPTPNSIHFPDCSGQKAAKGS